MNTHIHSAHEFIQTTASANSLSRPPAANLPVFVPGTTYSREEYTVCVFLISTLAWMVGLKLKPTRKRVGSRVLLFDCYDVKLNLIKTFYTTYYPKKLRMGS